MSIANEVGNFQYQIAKKLAPPILPHRANSAMKLAEHGGAEATIFRERLILDMMTTLSSSNRVYKASELESLTSNYPINLLVRTSKEQLVPVGIESAHPEDINAVASYLLPRFVNKNHYKLLNDAEIEFTDNAEEFYKKGGDLYVPSSRTRVYSLETDEKGHSKITFLLRHSIKDNYTDAQELVSSLSFLEGIRSYAKHQTPNNNYLLHKSQFDPDPKKKLELSKVVQDLRRGKGMTLKKSNLGLEPYWSAPQVINNPGNKEAPLVMQDVMNKLKEQLDARGIEAPKRVMYGNDFSVELLIGTGLMSEANFDHILKIATNNKVELVTDDMARTIKKDEDRDILKKYSAIQYLSRYEGGDSLMHSLKVLYQDSLNSIKRTIISPTYTALGSVISVIDFSNLSEEIISGIKNTTINEMVRGLKDIKYSYFSLPYPLGDSIYGLTTAFNREFGVEDFGFFGKVGVVPTPGSKSEKGRVVIPEYTAPSFLFDKNQAVKFKNRLKPEDTIIISAADAHEGMVSVNALSLQTLDDIKRDKELIKELSMKDGFPNLLLDMEAHWFNLACQDLGVIPSAIYYISDKTLEKYSPYEEVTTHTHTISQSLGAEGTLASLVSPYTIFSEALRRGQNGNNLRGTIYPHKKDTIF